MATLKEKVRVQHLKFVKIEITATFQGETFLNQQKGSYLNQIMLFEDVLSQDYQTLAVDSNFNYTSLQPPSRGQYFRSQATTLQELSPVQYASTSE